MPYEVSKQRFGQLVEKALAGLPEPFASHLEELRVEILWQPPRKILREAGLRDDDWLLGYYRGVPVTHRSVEHSGTLPEVIYIFQEDVQEFSRDEQDLIRQVRITVLHELGHHFGLDEEDLDKLGYS